MAGRLFRGLTLILTIALLAIVSQAALGQGGGGNDGGGGGGGGGDGADGSGLPGGIEIDAAGVLSTRTVSDYSRTMDIAKAKAAMSVLNPELQKPTDLRFLSLNRLEAETKKFLDAGKPLPGDIKNLAGLTRLTHVFYFPESQDIVIGGPAEGYFTNSQNRVVGTNSGKAILQLQDLVVALRAHGPDGRKTNVISCSIDPTQEGLAALQSEVSRVERHVNAGGRISDGDIVNLFRQAMGMQVITVKGISPKTRMAHILIDADYHMKLIGIGVERAPVRITTFIEKTTPMAKSSLIRWYLQPEYECLRVSEDETAMELVGSTVELVGANERVSVQGKRSKGGKGNRASRLFCSSFTKMYDKLAEAAPLYGDLQNVMDMTIAAAFIQQMDFYGQADWEMSVFGDESQYAVETLPTPKYVESVINSVRKGSQLMTPIAGGVNIQPRAALSTELRQADTDGNVQKVKDSISLDNLADGQWWWN